MNKRDESHADIDLRGGQSLRGRGPPGRLHVLHIGKSLGTQELFGDVLGGDADAGNQYQPELRRLGPRLGGGDRFVLRSE